MQHDERQKRIDSLFADALNLAPNGFVAVAPDDADFAQQGALSTRLERLRIVMKRGDLRRLTLLFRDGLSIEIARTDAFRFWRKPSLPPSVLVSITPSPPRP